VKMHLRPWLKCEFHWTDIECTRAMLTAVCKVFKKVFKKIRLSAIR